MSKCCGKWEKTGKYCSGCPNKDKKEDKKEVKKEDKKKKKNKKKKKK